MITLTRPTPISRVRDLELLRMAWNDLEWLRMTKNDLKWLIFTQNDKNDKNVKKWQNDLNGWN